MPHIPQATRCAYPGTSYLRAGPISRRANSRLQQRRCGFQIRACCVPAGPLLDRTGLAPTGELPVQALKHGVGTVICPHTRDTMPRMFDHASGLEHDFQHDKSSQAPLQSQRLVPPARSAKTILLEQAQRTSFKRIRNVKNEPSEIGNMKHIFVFVLAKNMMI